MEKQITLNELLAKILARFDHMDERIRRLEDKVEQMDIRLTYRIDCLEKKVDAFIVEQKAFNTKIDDRVTQLETWRNTYN
jgi:hypothetical protein